MSTVLEQLYASGGSDVVISTIELTCAAWSDSLLFCEGFEDQTCITEDGRTLTFLAAPIRTNDADKDNQGAQTLDFVIDGVLGEAQQHIDAALQGEQEVKMTYRKFLESNRSEPAEAPYRMTILGGEISDGAVQLQAGYFDLIGRAFPRDIYNTQFAPGLKYL